MIERSNLSHQIKKIIAYNLAPISLEWASVMSSFYSQFKNNPTLNLILQQNYNKYKERLNYQYDPLMSICPAYVSSLAKIEYFDLLIQPSKKKIEFQNLYSVFKTKYSGQLREVLIGNLFGFGVGWGGKEAIMPKTFDSLMKDGEKYIKTPIIKHFYDIKLKQNIGTDIFNGIFQDLAGNNINIASFKGKVVLIDFWFTGCGACATFHKNFHQKGFPQLRKNKEFIYLSISLDKKREDWLKGIDSGQYSSNEYMNLNSNLGFGHPFIKYYERATFPFLLLIDTKSQIYFTDPVPEPDAIVDLINKAIKESVQKDI